MPTMQARGADRDPQQAACAEQSSGSQQLSQRWSQQLSQRWSQNLSRRWQAEVINGLDDLWEDDDGGSGETADHRLLSTVNGLPVTTLMLRNLPEHVTQDNLLRILPKPKKAKYNLLYVPQPSVRRQTSGAPRTGSAFLNFETHQDAIAFCRAWHGREIQMPPGNTGDSSQVEIEAAKTQGQVCNLFRLRTKMRGVSDPAKLPAVFTRGKRQDFWGYIVALQNFARGFTVEQDGVTWAFHC